MFMDRTGLQTVVRAKDFLVHFQPEKESTASHSSLLRTTRGFLRSEMSGVGSHKPELEPRPLPEPTISTDERNAFGTSPGLRMSPLPKLKLCPEETEWVRC